MRRTISTQKIAMTILSNISSTEPICPMMVADVSKPSVIALITMRSSPLSGKSNDRPVCGHVVELLAMWRNRSTSQEFSLSRGVIYRKHVRDDNRYRKYKPIRQGSKSYLTMFTFLFRTNQEHLFSNQQRNRLCRGLSEVPGTAPFPSETGKQADSSKPKTAKGTYSTA